MFQKAAAVILRQPHWYVSLTKNFRTTAKLKAIMAVYGKTFTGLDPKKEYQTFFVCNVTCYTFLMLFFRLQEVL